MLLIHNAADAHSIYSHYLAEILRLEGFSAICILPGGWMEWTTGIRPRTRRPDTNRKSESVKWRLNEDGTASPI